MVLIIIIKYNSYLKSLIIILLIIYNLSEFLFIMKDNEGKPIPMNVANKATH